MQNYADSRAIELRAATLGGGIPAVGWARVAMSIVAARQSETSVLVVEFGDHPSLTINLDRHEFAWYGAVGQIPDRVSVLRVLALPEPTEETPASDDLDVLLWSVGLSAFGSERAGWLDSDSRVRLIGWPNLTVLSHTPEQVRMTAALGSAFLTANELAESFEVELGEANALINALGLMDLLQSSPITETQAPSLPTARRGLFRRLRTRLGL